MYSVIPKKEAIVFFRYFDIVYFSRKLLEKKHRLIRLSFSFGVKTVNPAFVTYRLRLGVTYEKSVTLGNVTMSHRTRERPAECLASLSHSTMIGLPRAQH
ncbi:hypothetical protein EVAR_27816_1 [Eumeta japonica]|uniref:Uncharacterized protein n=1 Tax=Eumeta variegata TaxID=151549 RepID=A0A4C1VJ70_EUMVA|nr:hypothetical protein EVAR_27816_1 [Eumeta japonica]